MSSPNPVTSYNFELLAAALAGSGSPSPAIVVYHRDPTTTDLSGPAGNYAIGQLWYSTLSLTYFGLLSVSAGSANWGALGTASSVTVPNGGTGASSFTAHGVVIGEGTSPLQSTSAGTTGQVLIGSTGADPAFGNLGVNSGLTAHGVLLGENNSSIVATTAGSNGQLLIGSTGADPAFATVTTTTGLAFTTGAHALAINVAHDGYAISSVAGTSQAMTAQTCYIANNAGATTFSLPSVAAVGDTFKVVGGAGNTAGWVIQAGVGQTIYQSSASSTSGGTATGPANGAASIELMCTSANSSFVIMYANDTVILA